MTRKAEGVRLEVSEERDRHNNENPMWLTYAHRRQAHTGARLLLQCAVTRWRIAELLGESARANCVRLCIWVRRNTWDT